MIKVAHVTTIDLSLRYLLLNQLVSLQADGYDVTGISATGPDVPHLEARGIRHIAVPMTRRVTPLADLRSIIRLYRVLRREQFTIVHTHTPKPNVYGQIAARLARVPVRISTAHGFYFHDGMNPVIRRFLIALEKIGASGTDLIFSVNHEDVQTAIREGICPPGKITVLGSEGIDVSAYHRDALDEAVLAQKRADLGLPPGVPVVGFVGRLVAEKGLPELLQAAPLIRAAVPDVRFLIVGPVDYEKADVFKPEDAARYGVGDICVFTGMRTDTPDLYGLMDVFVLPSHREGLPRSPMEASSTGVPCVVTDIRGCREAVRHGENGLLVPLGDVNALAAAVIDLLTDRDKARRMGERGRQMALDIFDERRVINRLKTEYARLLREKGLA